MVGATAVVYPDFREGSAALAWELGSLQCSKPEWPRLDVSPLLRADAQKQAHFEGEWKHFGNIERTLRVRQCQTRPVNYFQIGEQTGAGEGT